MMKDLVQNFPLQLEEALEIGKSFKISHQPKKIENIIILGLGGSGIGGSIAKDSISMVSKIPVEICNTYDIPKYVGETTLCIASSYSGNTEETLEAVKKAKKAGAIINVITSGGQLLKIAKKNNYPYIQIPGGNPPRACLGYSLTQLFYVLNAYNITDASFIKGLKESINLLKTTQKEIIKQAKVIAKKIHDKIPVIYVVDGFESVAIRWRQQINENSKMLCWHHKIPEMNHNELVGWREENQDIAVLFMTTKFDHPRSLMRVALNKSVVKKYTKTIIDIKVAGKDRLNQAMYLIHLGDWLSIILADIRNYVADEIDVINNLKSALSKK